MEIFDIDRVLRATISEEGEVRNAKGVLVAYVNEDGSAGDMFGNRFPSSNLLSSNEAMLGDINNGQVVDGNDEILGSIDEGRGLLRKGQSLWGEIIPGGELRDRNEAYRGKIDNFTFHKFLRVAAYLFFVDQQIIQDDLPSLLGKSPIFFSPKN